MKMARASAGCPPAALAAALVGVAVGLGPLACGGGARDGSPASTAASGLPAPDRNARLPQIELKADADIDSDAYGSEPDNESEQIGPPASAAGTAAVATLVRRYYAAAATENGGEACRLLYRTVAEAVPEDYGSVRLAPGLHESQCATALSKLFRASHGQIAAESRGLRVTAVRVGLNKAAARFSWHAKEPSHYILAHRERGAWKIGMLVGTEQPIVME